MGAPPGRAAAAAGQTAQPPTSRLTLGPAPLSACTARTGQGHSSGAGRWGRLEISQQPRPSLLGQGLRQCRNWLISLQLLVPSGQGLPSSSGRSGTCSRLRGRAAGESQGSVGTLSVPDTESMQACR